MIQNNLFKIGLLLAAFLWGSTFFVIKDSLVSVNPLAMIAYRFALAAIIFFAIALFQKGDIRKNFWNGFILGIINWIVFVPQVIGLQYTTASNSGFITGLFVIFVPILGFIFFKKRSNLMQVVAVIIAVIGLWFLTGGFQRINTGDLLTLITATGNALYILVVDKFVRTDNNPFVLNFQQTFTVAFLSFITIFFFHYPLQVANINTVLAISYLAIFATVIAFGVMFVAQKHVKPLTASLLMSMEPVFAAILAWTIGGEKIIAMSAIGGILIFLAIIVSELPMSKIFLKNRESLLE